MKVQDIIKCLQDTYQPDTELVIAWWDRDLFLVHDGDDMRELTTDEWHDVVATMNDRGLGDYADSCAYDSIYDTVTEVITNRSTAA